MIAWTRLLIPAALLVCGCAHGFDRNALRERLNDGSIQSNDADIAEVRELKPQLRFPCRIAVYLKPSLGHDWRWTPEDKAVMEKWADALKKDGVASEVIMLPEVLTGKGEPKELRLAAAKVGADALFVVHGAAQTDSYKNFAAVFDLTLVGGLIIPASHKDTLFLMEGVLLDVDNGYIYTGVQTEGVGKIRRPTFVIDERDSVLPAKAQAVARFGDEVLKQMRALASKPCLPCDKPPAPKSVPGVQPAGFFGAVFPSVTGAPGATPKPAAK